MGIDDTAPAQTRNTTCTPYANSYFGPRSQDPAPIESGDLTLQSGYYLANMVSVKSSVPVEDVELIAPKDIKLRDWFAKGWKSIPNELKMEILEYCVGPSAFSNGGLVTGMALRPYSLHPHHRRMFLSNPVVLFQELEKAITFLSMGSDISRISRKIFYEKNVFVIKPCHELAKDKVPYPPQSINNMIRKVMIHIRPRVRDYTMIEKLSKGELGFENLREVHVLVDARCSLGSARLQLEALERKMLTNPIEFDVEKLGVIWIHALEQGEALNPILWPTLIPDKVDVDSTILPELESSFGTKSGEGYTFAMAWWNGPESR